jgi:hypothetical protein
MIPANENKKPPYLQLISRISCDVPIVSRGISQQPMPTTPPGLNCLVHGVERPGRRLGNHRTNLGKSQENTPPELHGSFLAGQIIELHGRRMGTWSD